MATRTKGWSVRTGERSDELLSRPRASLLFDCVFNLYRNSIKSELFCPDFRDELLPVPCFPETFLYWFKRLNLRRMLYSLKYPVSPIVLQLFLIIAVQYTLCSKYLNHFGYCLSINCVLYWR